MERGWLYSGAFILFMVFLSWSKPNCGVGFGPVLTPGGWYCAAGFKPQ